MLGRALTVGTGQELRPGFARRRQPLEHAIEARCNGLRLDPPHIAKHARCGDLDLLQRTIVGNRKA
jgi:hypothetical protein